MARTVYVVVSKDAINDRKSRERYVVYDGVRIFKIGKLTELKNVDEVFMDAIYPSIYAEVLELLRSGVKVYVLKDRRILEKYKKEMVGEDD